MAILPGTRIRDNGVFGNITDNPLTIGATTFNSANLSLLSAVTGNHALVTLDPLRQFGAPEIVMVTAHTAAATVATIQRGMFGTAARAHPVNTLWVHAAADNDYREIVTSGTRPADQYEGQSIYETDTDRLVSFTGAAWQQDGLFFDPPACRIFHNTTQSAANGASTILTFNSERYDPSGMHDTGVTPSRITITIPGLYLITGHVEFVTATDYTFKSIRPIVNGTNIIAILDDPGPGTTVNNGHRLSIATVWKFAANDFIELQVRQDNGAAAARNVTSSASYSPEFSATWIGRGN